MNKVLVDREEIEAVRNTLANGGGAVGVLRWAESVLAAQPAEAEGDRIASGFVILDGMAFSKDEILAQRVDLCNALESLSAVTAERDRLAAALSAPDTIKAEPAGDYANLRKQFMSLNALANSNAKMVKYWRDQCGHETRETLLANAANVNAERDTNALLTDSLEAAEAERDRLRAKVERYVPLHEAIQRAAGELPEGWAIQLYIERNGGGVELIGPDGTEDFATNNERLDYTVIDALEAAMAAKEA